MSDQALAIWREKLAFLQAQLALASDPSQKYTIQKQIEEAQAKIRELSGAPAEPAPPHPAQSAGSGGPTAREPHKASERDGDNPPSPTVPWYKDYRFVVPIAVALIGLLGTLAGLWKSDGKEETATRSVQVVVSDAATGSRVARARVWADGYGNPRFTEGLGRTTLMVPGKLDSLRIRAEKEGYEPYDQDLQLIDALVEIPLTPKPPPQVPPAASSSAPPPMRAVRPAPAAPTSFQVVVFDEATNGWVRGARITPAEQKAVFYTDNQGSAMITVRPSIAAVRLTVEHPGFEAASLPLDIFQGMQPAQVFLKPKAAVPFEPTVKGKVTNPYGTPLPNVQIMVDGFASTQKTAADGQFQIVVPLEIAQKGSIRLTFRLKGFAAESVVVRPPVKGFVFLSLKLTPS